MNRSSDRKGSRGTRLHCAGGVAESRARRGCGQGGWAGRTRYPVKCHSRELHRRCGKAHSERTCRLDVLVNNAAISHTRRLPGMSVEEFAKSTRPSNVSLDELRAVLETNVFGVVAVIQAMLPLLREAPATRIANVSSGAGSLTLNSDPAFAWRSIFGPIYPASKTALNAMTLAMAIELESTGIKVNAASPGFTRTNLNNYAGTQAVEEGAREPVRLALLGPDGPTGTFSNKDGVIPW